MAAIFTVLGQSISSSCLLLLVSVLMVVSALLSRWRNRKLNAFMASMPGPTPIPFIGTVYKLFGLKMENLCDFLFSHAREYPKVAAHWLAGAPVLVTGDLEIMNALLASNHNTEKIPEYKFFANGSAGVFSASGQKWRSTRKVLTPGFKTNIQGASFSENYSYHLPTFLQTLAKYADDGKEHDVFSTVHSCLLDLVCDNIFDSRMDVQKRKHQLAKISEMASEMIYERLFNPLLWFNWLYTLFGKQKRFDDIVNTGHDIMQEMLEERIKVRNQLKQTNPTAERPQTYMEILLNNIDSGAMSKEQALEEIKELVIAGTLTTAACVSDILWLLGMFPEIQKKAYEEIREVCTGDEVTLDDQPNLVYVEMIVKEALRHFATPFVARQLVRDLKVNDKITIPGGVRVILGTWILHHSPEFWEKPNGFYPEHFTEASEIKRPKGAFVPFLSGPRNCPGTRYAMQTMKMVVATTLLHYELSSNRTPPQDIFEEKYRLLFLLRPAQGCMVQIKRRRPNKPIECSG